MNAAGIRWGGSSCADVNFGMHVITRTQQIKLTISLCGSLTFTKGASTFLDLGITNSSDAFIIEGKFLLRGLIVGLLASLQEHDGSPHTVLRRCDQAIEPSRRHCGHLASA